MAVYPGPRREFLTRRQAAPFAGAERERRVHGWRNDDSNRKYPGGTPCRVWFHDASSRSDRKWATRGLHPANSQFQGEVPEAVPASASCRAICTSALAMVRSNIQFNLSGRPRS
jgi:hypothetical protein